MTRTDVERLADARDHAEHARMIHHEQATGLLAARATYQSILYDVIVTGESLHHVSPAVQSLSSDIPWASSWATRNRIVHAYWRADRRLVLEIVARDLPPLIDALDALRGQQEDGAL